MSRKMQASEKMSDISGAASGRSRSVSGSGYVGRESIANGDVAFGEVGTEDERHA